MKHETKINQITNESRILSIIERLCKAKMRVLVRVLGNPPVTIRGGLKELNLQYGSKNISLDRISSKGNEYIMINQKVEIEVLGMKTRMMFESTILQRLLEGCITISIPTALLNIERRQNPRYPTTPAFSAFIRTSSKFWSPDPRDIKSPPIIPIYDTMSTWCHVIDLSLGGACFSSRFPSMFENAERIKIDSSAELILPMGTPVLAPFVIKWKKKLITTKENINGTSVEGIKSVEFRFGIEFMSNTDELSSSLKLFLRNLAVADAI
ncbi:MAG: PilZ domain-containing protein [Oligoflexales bacterium]|nr:PilZ domain-containing protein [Oligoflexales bacterium]